MVKETEVDEPDDNPVVELLDHRVNTSVKRGRPVPGQTRSSAMTSIEPARAKKATSAKGERMVNHSLEAFNERQRWLKAPKTPRAKIGRHPYKEPREASTYSEPLAASIAHIGLTIVD